MRRKRLCFSILLCTSFAITLNAQTGWEWQNPLPQGNNLTRIDAVSQQVAYVAGEWGALVKTTNGGTEWQKLRLPRTITAQSLQFLDPFNGWVSGSLRDSLFLFSTHDGGSSWVILLQSNGTNISFYRLTASMAWLGTDSILYRTVDGGITWQPVYSGFTFVQLHFMSASAGWGIGGQFFLRTTDGGSTWIRTTIGVEWGVLDLQQCTFADAATGWMIGIVDGFGGTSGYLLKTPDGGASWYEQLVIGEFPPFYFLSIESASEDLCWAVAQDGALYRTTNGGDQWVNIRRVPYLHQLVSLGNGILLGGGSYGNLLTSPDSGMTWNQVSSGYTLGEIGDMMVLDSERVFAVGGNTVLRTIDGGATWNGATLGFPPGYASARSVWFIDSLRGWIGAEYGGGWGGLYRTTDGGQSWEVQIDSLSRVFDIHFLNQDLGWFTESERMHFSSDGGESWSVCGTVPSIGFYSIFFASPTSGWAGGSGGLVNSTDGGVTWNVIWPGGISIFTPYDIFFLDSETGWVLGQQMGSFYVFRTTDGGTTWGSYLLWDHGFNQFFPTVEFVDRTHGWIVVSNPFSELSLLSTADGGAHWTQEEAPTSLPLSRIRFSRDRHGWLLGEGGVILRTSDPVTTVKEGPRPLSVPASITLGQNYPNPFNPLTTITYDLPVDSRVSLKIFNVLGQEVASLVHEDQQAGHKSVEWNASLFASGIYFYRLDASPPESRGGRQAGSFTNVKKLLILK